MSSSILDLEHIETILTDLESGGSPLSRLEDAIEYISSPTFEELDVRCQNLSIERLCRVEPIEVQIRNVSLDHAEVGLSTYLAELRRVPLLEGDQEYEIFRWMNYLKYRASELLKNKQFSAREVNRILSRAEQIRNSIVSSNLRLVVSIAKKLVDQNNRLEDLISDGNLPLIRSAEIFDFERGTRFSTYATWAIRNALLRSSPRNRMQAYRYASGIEDAFSHLVDERSSVRADEQYHQQISETVGTLLEDLNERDRLILCSRFGVNEESQPFRLREIAKKLGISTERVRQLLSRSLDRLRTQMDELTLELC